MPNYKAGVVLIIVAIALNPRLIMLSAPQSAARPDVQDIIRRSVEKTDEDWKANPEFGFTESDVVRKGGHATRRTFHVWMLDGSPYNELIAENGKPLSSSRVALEKQKLASERRRRDVESPTARQHRIAHYEQERHQDHALMREMVKAFTFTLAGEGSMNGRDCYIINAEPRAGYRPPSMETEALTGMRGKLWIDKSAYQWVKVHAQAFKTVTIGGLIAHVQPGTEFTLEQAPVGEGVWLPTHFLTRVQANVLFLFSKNYSEHDTFSNYQHVSTTR